MEFSKQKILLNKINQIGKYSVKEVVSIPIWRAEHGYFRAPGQYDRQDCELILTPGKHWICSDSETYWFSADVAVPEGWRGGRVFLDLDFGGEGIVRINGQIVSAVTSYLQENKQQRNRVLVAEELCGSVIHVEAECALNYMEFMKFRAAGWTNIEYTLRSSRLILIDDEIEKYYFDSLVAYEALEEIAYPYDRIRQGNVKVPRELQMYMYQNGKDSYMYSKVLEVLQTSINAVDVDFDRDVLAASIPEASRILREGLAAINYTTYGHIVFTGNSHIDTAWLWPVKETTRKAAKTFSNALTLMEQYPDHIFAHSQPYQYAQVKKHYPELFEQIKRRVQEGRWELIGNSWVEADANVPSGEALVRQLLYGREFFLKEFGKASDVYWMPDVFGYSWALPQIIKRSGMKYFFTSKLINNDINRFPYTLFSWQGVDGTCVTAYLQRMSYNGEINPFYINFDYKDFDQQNITDTMFQTYGFGDGGGGPTYQMLEFAKRLKHFPGLPDTSIGRTEEFYSTVPEDKLPVWNDEMYYEFHRGTYTSQAAVKRNNRKGELGLREAEMASSIAEVLCGTDYPMDNLTDAWKLLLLNQFHDIIPGSSIHQVYEDSKTDYAEIFKLLHGAQARALAAITARIGTEKKSVVVYNFLSWKRRGVVSVRTDARFGVKDTKCAVRADGDGWIVSFMAEDVPAMGYRVYELTDDIAQTGTVLSASVACLENNVIRVEMDAQGVITSLYDKENDRETLCGKGNLLTVYEDKPERESAWNIDIEYRNKFWTLDQAESVEVVECSPHRAAVRIVRIFNKSCIEQTVSIYPGSRRVDFETHVDWKETEKLLKVSFDVDVLSPRAAYEIAYGTIERPTHTNTLWDQAKFEVAAHKWADLSEGEYGVALLNDCKYGYDIHNSTMRLTLLRSPIYPDPTADKGEHDFTYAIYPHVGGWREADVVRAGYEVNVSLTAEVTEAHEGDFPLQQAWIEMDGKDVVIEALKKSQSGEGWILRLYEAKGGRGKVKASAAFGFSEIWETNLMEEKEKQLDSDGHTFEFVIKPFEIKTFLIK